MSVALATREFTYGGKAVHTAELEDGDLLIEGWAARYGGLDRENEGFAENSFREGIKAFLGGHRPLCFHHRKGDVIGEVLSLEDRSGEGVWLRARVDHQPESSPLRWVYNAIRRGSMKGLSVGGFFRRALTAAGRRIVAVDLTECSVTGVPVDVRTGFAVVGGKALGDADEPLALLRARHEAALAHEAQHAADMMSLRLGAMALRARARQ